MTALSLDQIDIEGLQAMVESYKSEVEKLKAEKAAFHAVARDFWIYGRPSIGKSLEWNRTLAEFDRLELNIL